MTDSQAAKDYAEKAYNEYVTEHPLPKGMPIHTIEKLKEIFMLQARINFIAGVDYADERRKEKESDFPHQKGREGWPDD
jgi:hypothetical protein